MYLGVVSYSPRCVEMIMQLDDSPMANELRQHIQRRHPPTLPADGTGRDSMHARPELPAAAAAVHQPSPRRPPPQPAEYNNMDVQSRQAAGPAIAATQYPSVQSMETVEPTPDAFPQLPEGTEARQPQSYADLRQEHRARSAGPAVYADRPRPSFNSPPQRPRSPDAYADVSEEQVNSLGLIDPQPKPTRPSDREHRPIRYNKYGDPVEE